MASFPENKIRGEESDANILEVYQQQKVESKGGPMNLKLKKE